MSKFAVVLPAGGLGKRMGADRPKQLLKINNKPMFLYALEKFINHPKISEVVLCYPADWKEYFVKEIGSLDVKLVEGGPERWLSVRNGIDALSSDIDYALVHDVARPFVSDEIIDNVIEITPFFPCIVAKKCADTVKQVKYDSGGKIIIDKTIDRKYIYLAQTPQAFSVDLMKELYERADLELDFIPTDEASILEYFEYPVNIISGNIQNDKITTKEDLVKFNLS